MSERSYCWDEHSFPKRNETKYDKIEFWTLEYFQLIQKLWIMIVSCRCICRIICRDWISIEEEYHNCPRLFGTKYFKKLRENYVNKTGSNIFCCLFPVPCLLKSEETSPEEMVSVFGVMWSNLSRFFHFIL